MSLRLQTTVAALQITLLLFSLVAPVYARGPWRASETNTGGWQLMTQEERIEHQSKVRHFDSLEACRHYQLEHHQLMEERAQQRGMALPAGRRDICEHLQPGKAAR
jgi:hypothetical protein